MSTPVVARAWPCTRGKGRTQEARFGADPAAAWAIGACSFIAVRCLSVTCQRGTQICHDRARSIAQAALRKGARGSLPCRRVGPLVRRLSLRLHDGDSLRWSPIAVELCLVDSFPRKATLGEEDVTAIPDALRRLVRYAGRHKGLSRASFEETLGAIENSSPATRRPFRCAWSSERSEAPPPFPGPRLAGAAAPRNRCGRRGRG